MSRSAHPRGLTLARLATADSPAPVTTRACEVLLEEGQAAERRGQRAEARALYEQALGSLRTEADGARTSTILRWIARTYVGDAQMDAALDCLNAAVAIAEACGDEGAAGSAINIQAVVHWQLGDLDEAERLYLTARTRALRAGDAKLAAMTAQNLGVIANVRGELTEARQHYEASLEEYRALGSAKDMIGALNNLGLLHTHTQDWAAAEHAFGEAIRISELQDDVSTRMLIDVNLAEMWVARQDYGRAHVAVRHAMELANRSGDGSSMGQASKLLGVIARETGDPADAEEHFRRAEEIAATRQDMLLQAEVAREAGELARRQGHNKDVLRYLNRAHRLFAQLRARRDLADIDRRNSELEAEFLQVARRWGESIEAKDRYTQGHCLRVADLACAMAADLGMADQDLFWFRIGALLHDVGKIVIPEAVLNKAGKLTDAEWALMRSHTTAGVDMLAGVEFPWDVLPIIRSHHEKWDGTGYPDQLRGEAIPLVARILCVADVYDALTSTRSYKRALAHVDAVEIMRRDVGVMFDPAVFASFERVVSAWALRTEPAVSAPVAPEPEAAAPAAAPPAAPVPELDDLTALPLRRAFREAAERVLDARRTTERPVSLLVMDIDHFKLVNDCFGHQQGDDALRMVATLLQQAARRSDFIARYAGDELVALLPGSTLEDAVAMAEHLRAGVECASCPRRDGSPDPVRVTLSIGVASAPTHGQSFDELFAAADGALYAAKRRGRNAVAMASATTGSPEAALLLDGFIGRHAERQRLRQLLEVAANGAPRVVAVVGEAGIGKSTLLRQLGPEIGVRAGALLVGRCLEADVRPPYGPWADVIGAIHALGLVPLRPWRELGRLVPALGAPADRPETPVAASAARYTLMHEIEEYLTRAATARPLVIVLDDMHWGDRETWDVLELLVPRLSGQRLLLCLALRREDVPADVAQRMSRLSRHECVSELTLGRLSHDELEHWLRSALGGRPLDSALLDHVADHTEGNPLFAVQSLQMLLEEEVLSFDDGAWRYRPQAEQPMPTAVRELLTRRLARLSDATREVLTAAAIVGTRFDADLLLATTTRDEGTVLEALDEGVRVQVLTSGAPDSPTTYEFTHGLLADVLRRSGNPLRMRRMHERVARLLAARPTSAPADIATHFDQAGCGPEALSQAVCAADRAMSVYAYDAAATCLTLASRHTVTPVEHADVVWRQAMLDETVGRYEKAERHCEALLTEHGAGATAIGVTRKARRMVQRLRLLRGASAAEVGISCQQLYEAALAADDHAESVALLMMLSQVHGRLGNDAEAERTASTAVSVARSLGDTALLADAIMREGSAMLTTAPADTVRHYRQALDLFTQRHDRRGQLRCQINIGVACDRAGNHPAAELAYASALDIGREVQAADLTALASMNLGVLLMKLGRFTEASQRFEDTLRSASAAHHEPHRLGALYNLAHLARERGDPAGATERYGAAIRLARQLGQLDIHVGATCGIGLAELALGRLASARAQLQAAQSILDGRPQWFQGRELFVALGVRLQLAAGATDNAVRTLCDTLAVADGFDSYAAVWLAAECAAAVRAVGGPPDRWHAVNARYTVHARALGYAPLLDRLAGTTPEHRMPEGGLADGEAPSGRFAA
ncbi:MAG: diguanylate cyclase [Gemmatimonas sp.]|jgi:diguanylate cyclase (GGDEF)-like protein/putative nucleotidyltransferase with HDIG domain|uniref:diguanylate cyclase n=1 Tax=Gemmatimonas sp. TaxID=1962908 RepID=UPI00391F6AB0|nr:diguanylate cyclase [Gemmatimonadota bacterium]